MTASEDARGEARYLCVKVIHSAEWRARVPAERVGDGEGRGAWGDPAAARVLDSSFMFQ